MKPTQINKDKKIKLPGMRVIKTVIAVNICFLLSILRKSSPFYSAIAAILCIQSDNKNSWEAGKSRMIGTLIGGAYGLINVVLNSSLNIELNNYVYYLILSLFLIPIIYTNVYVKAPSSTYISCVVFLSITVSHGGDEVPAYFALNRVVDTLIGICVALIVNKYKSSKQNYEKATS